MVWIECLLTVRRRRDWTLAAKNCSKGPTALSIQGLVKIHLGPVAALRGVDLELHEELFGLLGPNGAGKCVFMQVSRSEPQSWRANILLSGEDLVPIPLDVGNDPASLGCSS